MLYRVPGRAAGLRAAVLDYHTRRAIHADGEPLFAGRSVQHLLDRAPAHAGSTTLKRVGSRPALASCEITSNGRPVASGSGVFSVPPARQAES